MVQVRTNEAWETVLEELFRRERATVLAYARSRLRPADAEDVTAEVFQRAAIALRAAPDTRLGQGWLIFVARNLIVDWWRREARRSTWAMRDHEPAAVHHEVWDRPGDDVRAALDGLDRGDRSVLVMRYVDGCSAREIAESTGRSTAAVESTVRRARQRLALAYAGEQVR